MRKRGKVDANQDEIVQALRQVGCSVLSLAALGTGVPDLLVRRGGTLHLHLLEIKNGSKPPSKRKLTDDQIDFCKLWPVTVVNNIDEALKAVMVKK